MTRLSTSTALDRLGEADYVVEAIVEDADAKRALFTSLDAFVTYTTRLFRDRVRTRFQLNARNLQEWKSRLEPVGAYPDGSIHTFRIVDPGMFIFSATFDL